MNILLIGSGGREHAIAHCLSKSDRLKKLYVAPGNPGTFQCAENVPISVNDTEALITFAKAHQIDFTFVGPEQPLADGIVDAFQAQNLRIIGPNQDAAQLESSKAWAKSKYKQYGIPTSDYEEFRSYDDAISYIKVKNQFPIVIKADGLAAGKGVTIAENLDHADQALKDCFLNNIFKDAGECVVIEDFLEGEEASLFAFTDGKTVLPMVSAQDHKAIYDGDKGPNTGGMGAYSPAPVFTNLVQDKVMQRILKPLIDGFNQDGINYKGILYAGLMIDSNGDPYVVEFNIRFGDPETQIVLPKLETDLIDIFTAISNETLSEITLSWRDDYSVCVVIAADGYPGSYEKGKTINGLNDSSDSNSFVYHAGTVMTDAGDYLTNGGRVLNVCAESKSLEKAIESVYKRCESISFDGAYYRRDIGQKGLVRLSQAA
ncbi:MAG: phosphoribosylamine--glycine ligase [Candidatus Margulisiibacteriota bacterium]